MAHLTDEDLVLHYYGELPASDEIAARRHLEGCAVCRTEFGRLQQVLGVVNESSLYVDVPPSFERTVWAKLEPALRRHRSWSLRWLVASPAPLALAATVVVLVAAAFFAGRAFSPAPPSTAGASTAGGDELRTRVLLADLGEHLERSEMVLVELVGTAGNAAVDLSSERARAEELAASSRLYRLAAEEAGRVELVELLDDIERVLTEIAAISEQPSPDDLSGVQRRIESEDLIFKLRVVSSELHERQREALRRRLSTRS